MNNLQLPGWSCDTTWAEFKIPLSFQYTAGFIEISLDYEKIPN